MTALRLTIRLVAPLALLMACTSAEGVRASGNNPITDVATESSAPTTAVGLTEEAPIDLGETEIEWDSFSFTVSDDDAQQPFTAEVTINGAACPASQTGVTEWDVTVSPSCLAGDIVVTAAPFPMQLADIYSALPRFFYVGVNADNPDEPIWAVGAQPLPRHEQVEEGDYVALPLVSEMGHTIRRTSPDGPPSIGLGVWATEAFTVEDSSDEPSWTWSDQRTRYTRLGFVVLSGSSLDLGQADIAVCEAASYTTCT